MDPKGNTTQMAYDGASRMIESVQHMRASGGGDQPPSPSPTSATGGSSASALGASSPASSAQQGTFMPASGSVIRTQTVYDGNSRVVALVDSNGGTTNYTYDALNRQVTMEFADGTKRTNTYNACSSVVMYIDEAGNEFTNTYDSLGRRVAVDIDAESGFEGTTGQTFEYDGLGRQTKTTDTTAGDVQITQTQYDSLSRVLEFAQTTAGDTQYMSNTGFASLVNTQQQYPNDALVDWAYDILYRKASVKDHGAESNTATWSYAGPGRVVEVVLKNGIACTMLNNTRTASVVQTMIAGSGNTSNPLPMFGTATSDRLGYDGSGRMVAKRFIPAVASGPYTDTTTVVGFTTSFDKAGNKYYERLLHAENRSHLYQPYPWNYNTAESATGGSSASVFSGPIGLFPPPYDPNASGIDSANRLRQYQRGTLAGPIYGYLPTGALPGTPGSGGHAITQPIDLPGTDSFKNYTLDALGNWESTASTQSVAPSPSDPDPVLEQRNHNLLNQITRRKVGNGEWVDFVYDKNGNLRDDGERLMKYDALNRLIEVKAKNRLGQPIIGEYTYNAMTFRTLKTVSHGGLYGNEPSKAVPNGTTRFLYNASWQVMEDRALSGSAWMPAKQSVWGLYIDELIRLKLLEDAGPHPLEAGDYYLFQDMLYRSAVLSDDEGQIAEAYDIDKYGNRIILIAPGDGWWAADATTSSWSGCVFGHHGLLHDEETACLINNRNRVLHSILGRYNQKDRLGYINGMSQYCNYADGAGKLDPSGLDMYIQRQNALTGHETVYVELGWDKKGNRIIMQLDFRDGGFSVAIGPFNSSNMYYVTNPAGDISTKVFPMTNLEGVLALRMIVKNGGVPNFMGQYRFFLKNCRDVAPRLIKWTLVVRGLSPKNREDLPDFPNGVTAGTGRDQINFNQINTQVPGGVIYLTKPEEPSDEADFTFKIDISESDEEGSSGEQ